jgi:hypothetical protein
MYFGSNGKFLKKIEGQPRGTGSIPGMSRSQDYRKYTIPTDIRGKVFPRDLCGKVFPTGLDGKVSPTDLVGNLSPQTRVGMFL